MKILKVIMIVLVLTAAAYPQTKDLGMGAFANDTNPILMAVDSAMVDWSMKKPYVMFILFMGSGDKTSSIAVPAKDVVLVYKGQEYHMPSVATLRGSYRGEIRDLDFYRHLGKEGIISSWVRLYDFPEQGYFFPPMTRQSAPSVKEAHMTALNGFVSPIYFKNPGFAKGDKLTIKVRDVKNPDITGECDVVLQ